MQLSSQTTSFFVSQQHNVTKYFIVSSAACRPQKIFHEQRMRAEAKERITNTKRENERLRNTLNLIFPLYWRHVCIAYIRSVSDCSLYICKGSHTKCRNTKVQTLFLWLKLFLKYILKNLSQPEHSSFSRMRGKPFYTRNQNVRIFDVPTF